jgi:hypothetical protein
MPTRCHHKARRIWYAVMATARGALNALDFGEVDSESEPDLERRFVRTEDFDRFLDPRNRIILGAKGSGKSALFEMFAKHLPSTHRLAGDRLSKVLIATGTGFGDTTELSGTDIQTFQQLGPFEYTELWKVYIAFKLAAALGRLGYTSDGPLRDFLRVTRRAPDYRIGPIISSAWRLVAGNPPAEIEVNVMGNGATIRSGRGRLDVLELFDDINAVLSRYGQRVWLLFDKIDELHPTDQSQRDKALEGLFPACLFVERAFPSILPRVFIRDDIYGPRLHFTNKSHYVGKQFTIRWDVEALMLMMLKRALATPEVREWVEVKQPELRGRDPEQLSEDERTAGLLVIFDERAYPGQNEAKTVKWMVDRATDAKGITFPRELISYGNIAQEKQQQAGGPGESSLISGRSVIQAYHEVSRIRCETYLSEFPDVTTHIGRFRGKHDSPYGKEELVQMFEDLDPCGLQAIERLHEIGMLGTDGGQDVSVASQFVIPRLYRSGLGLDIRARP